MKAIIVVLVILAVVVGGIFMWGVGVNNRLITAEQGVNAAWAQVQTVYQRRADLIPNLVETVKGFAAQERTVLEEVTRARASASQMTLEPRDAERPQRAPEVPGGAERSSAARCRGSWSPSSAIPTSSPTRTSSPSRASSRAPRTASPSSAVASTRRCRTTTRSSVSSPAASWPSFRGFKEKAYFEAAPGSEAAPKVKF